MDSSLILCSSMKTLALLSKIFCLPWNRWQKKIDLLSENSWPGEQKGPFHSSGCFQRYSVGLYWTICGMTPSGAPSWREGDIDCHQHTETWRWAIQRVNAAAFQVTDHTLFFPMSRSGPHVHQVVLVHAVFLIPFLLAPNFFAGFSIDCAQALPFMLSTTFWSMEGSAEFSFPLQHSGKSLLYPSFRWGRWRIKWKNFK